MNKYGREKSDLSDFFDETEVSDSLHIDEIAYRDDAGSYTEGENSLAEFEDIENQLSERVRQPSEYEGELTNYDDVLAEIDDGARQIDEIKNRNSSKYEHEDSDSTIRSAGSYDNSQLSEPQDHFNNFAVKEDDFNSTLNSAASVQINEQLTDGEYIEDPYTASQYSEDGTVNEQSRRDDYEVEEMLDELELHAKSNRVYDERESVRVSCLSPIGKQNKWASMPWLARQPSLTSSVTSEFSSNQESNQYRKKYKIEKQERKNTLDAYSDLQQEFTHQAKELAEAKQTIDQLRLGATVDLYGRPPAPAKIITQPLPQKIIHGAIKPAMELPQQILPGYKLPVPQIAEKTETSPVSSGITLEDSEDPDYDEIKGCDGSISSNSKSACPLTSTNKMSTPNFAKNNNDTIIEQNPKSSQTSHNSVSTDLALTTVSQGDEYVSGLETDIDNEMCAKTEIYRTDLLDKIDNIDDSIRNYKELIHMEQINLDERDNALRNLEQNTRKVEKNYTLAKSEVGYKKLDPDNDLSAEIIRVGKELAQLKQELEHDEIELRHQTQHSVYGESMATVKTSSSTETQIDKSRNGRSLSPSRIPVAPEAELHRRSSQKALNANKSEKSPVQSPKATKYRPVKATKPKIETVEKVQKSTPETSKVDPKSARLNPVSLADSGFISSYPSKPETVRNTARHVPPESAIRQATPAISNPDGRRSSRPKRKSEKVETKKPEVNKAQLEYHPVKRSHSFGVNACPMLRTSETQTDMPTKQRMSGARKFHSMSDIRKSRATSRAGSTYTDSSHTDAETVVHRRQRRSQSPKLRVSNDNLTKVSRIDFVEPDDNAIELEDLRNEIVKLKERMENRTAPEQTKPIIKSPVQSDAESKNIKLFSKLKNDVQKLRDEISKVKTKRVITDTSSVTETDSTYRVNESDVERKAYSLQPRILGSKSLQTKSPSNFQAPTVQAQQMQPVKALPPGYVPYAEVPSGVYMPLWVLPNKRGLIHAVSAPNLHAIPGSIKKSHRSRKYETDQDSETTYQSDAESRQRKKKHGHFYPINETSEITVYDKELDQRLRKAERATARVNERSSRLMRKARRKTYTTAFYGYV